MIQINVRFIGLCDFGDTPMSGGVERPMNCHIQYDFIAQTRTVVDAVVPCAGGRPAAPDVLRPNVAAENLVERHLAMLAALATDRLAA